MALRISNVRLSVDEPEANLPARLARILGVRPEALGRWRILRKSLDARDKDALQFVYTASVADVCANQGALGSSVEPAGCFPNPRRPWVVWVGDEVPELGALRDGLGPPLLALCCSRREERQYTPHITLGRVKGERAPAGDLATALARQAKWQGASTEVRENLVLSSELTPQGPVSTLLSRAKLLA